MYVGKSQNISEANNRGLQTQCPIGQVVGNPCRGRFNTERTVTWTSAKAAKKKTSPLIERPESPNKHGDNAKWFWNTRLSYFPQMYLWIHDKYSSIRFNSVKSGKRYFKTINFQLPLTQRLHSPVVKGRTFFCWGKLGCRFKSQRGFVQFFLVLSSFFLPFGFLLSSLTAGPVSFARFYAKTYF